jgi:hypothetical protein
MFIVVEKDMIHGSLIDGERFSEVLTFKNYTYLYITVCRFGEILSKHK